MTPNAESFRRANAKSPVVSGSAFGRGGEGARYTLKNGKSFDLTRAECEYLGAPKWPWDFEK